MTPPPKSCRSTMRFCWAVLMLLRQTTSFPSMRTKTCSSLSMSSTEAPQLFHHFTVCLVPPETNERVWSLVTKAREELRDPGLYRWPPHANLLYPFVDPNEEDIILESLQQACANVEPFETPLTELGTFGGKNRGVLWLKPSADDLLTLHEHLVEAFPVCRRQDRQLFSPHMTLSHFVDLDSAEEAKLQISKDWPSDIRFMVKEIYVLGRKGDDGQFERIATIKLGKNNSVIRHLEQDGSMLRFERMPESEEDWVREERMKMKNRRNRRGRGGRRSQSPRVPDTPEVIAAKRAERKAKREAMEKNVNS